MTAKKADTNRARIVLDHAERCVNNLFNIFEALRAARGPKAGTSTEDEQDVLRAALVFAAAGLDSALKELIRGSARALALVDPNVQSEFEGFVHAQIKGDSTRSDAVSAHKFLASVLSSASPQDRLLEEYVEHLTGASLQSTDQLFKTVKALGIEIKTLAENKPKLKTIFGARNDIIHEFDVKFTGKRGHPQRRRRARADIEDYTGLLLSLAHQAIQEVESKLGQPAT